MNDVAVNDEVRLSDLMTLRNLQPRLSKVFPSSGALDWFKRVHREELIRAGAIYVINGRLLAHPGRFERVALAIGERAARGGTRDSVTSPA